ncbi:sugar transferase [Bacillus sp. B190/17]|uniref:Sugar transferase n=1 Tax=Bacillus lumedeiriae TaxID=3058829 RepID=A0ABW8IC19_9BACI
MNKGRERRIYNMLLILFDLAFVHFSYFIACRLLDGSFVPSHYIHAAPWISAAILTIFYLFDFYTEWKRKSFQQVIYTIVLSLGTLAVLMVAAVIAYPLDIISFKVVMLAFFIQILPFIMSRFVIWHVIKAIHGEKKVLIISENEESGLSLADKVLSHSKGWFTISGFLPLREKNKLKSSLKEVDIVLIAHSIDKKQKNEVIGLCVKQGKEVLIVPEMYEVFVSGSVYEQVDDMLVFSVSPAGLTAAQRALKRTFDLIAAVTVLIVTSPFVIFLCIMIPLTSKGPIFFKQERLGRNGKPYQMYKFRSMVQDAEKNTGPVLAAEQDPRITPIGRIIRASRLDELPQLYNVLKGEMSLIGPRPERKFFIDQFQQQLPDYAYRMAVKPGLTGLAQVMAKYTTAVEDKLRFDLMYIRHYSFIADVKILLQTIRVIFQREQASGVKEKNAQREKQLLQLLNQYRAAGQ